MVPHPVSHVHTRRFVPCTSPIVCPKNTVLHIDHECLVFRDNVTIGRSWRTRLDPSRQSFAADHPKRCVVRDANVIAGGITRAIETNRPRLAIPASDQPLWHLRLPRRATG